MEQNCSGLIRFMFKKIRKNIAQILFSFLEVLFSILIKLKFSHNVIFSPPIIWLCNENMLLDYSSKTIRVFLMYNEASHLYILKLKRRIYYYYVPVKPHHLHISHFSPLLPTIISLLHFHLFITLNLNVSLYLSIPLHFILVLFIPILLL